MLISTPVVLIASVLLLVIGFVVGLVWRKGGDQREREELAAELEASRQELVDYKQQVTEHFGSTAELFHSMTSGYRAMYEHLAKGADDLCGELPNKLRLASPEQQLTLEADVANDTAADPAATTPPASSRVADAGTAASGSDNPAPTAPPDSTDGPDAAGQTASPSDQTERQRTA